MIRAAVRDHPTRNGEEAILYGGGYEISEELFGGKVLRRCHHAHRDMKRAAACANSMLRHWKATRRQR